MRLSSLAPLDLRSTRAASLTRARAELLAGKTRLAVVSRYPDLRRPVLSDGRHRVLVAMRLGWREFPVEVRTYGPRGGLQSRRIELLTLDALP